MAPLWSQVAVQLRYSRRPGLLGWIAAQTVTRWRLRARLRELVLDLSRCTAPAWAYPADGGRARLRPRASRARSGQVLRAPVRAAG